MSHVRLSSTFWTAIGPAPIDTAGGMGPISGRIEAVVADPANPKVVYLGADNGGIWKNVNPPDWTPLTDFMPSLNFNGYRPLVVHPANHDLVFGAVSGPGAGILNSTDAGATWTLLANSQFDGSSLLALVAHPTNTSLLYMAAGWAGAWTSTDGGSTWTQLGSLPGGYVCDLIMARFDAKTLFAAVVSNSGAAQSSNGIYKSTDGGSTWTQLAGGLPLAAALGSQFAGGAVRLESGTASGVVYASLLTLGPPGPSQAVTAVQRFRTKDGGTSWKALSASGGTLEARSWHLLLAVDPKNDKHIFANDAYSLYESHDSGGSWSEADAGIGYLSGINHFDWVNLSFDSNDNALVSADQGVLRYDPATGKWTSLISNLQVSEFYTFTPDPKKDGVAYAIGQDIFSEKTTGPVQWNVMEGGVGETGKILVDPHNTSRVCGFNPLDLNNFVLQSADAGATWTTIFPAPPGLFTANFISVYNQSAGYGFAYASQTAFAMDPANPARVLVAADQVYESTNIGSASPTWSSISGVLSSDPKNPFVVTLAIAPSDSNTVYASSQDQHLWVTYDDGSTWNTCDNGLSGLIRDLRIDPEDRGHVFAVSGGDVFLLAAEGAAWTSIKGNLPSFLSLNTIYVDWRGALPRLFVGTNRGVYQSVDLGVTWSKFSPALPNTSVSDLQEQTYEHPHHDRHVLVAATGGRGAWEILIEPWGAIAVALGNAGIFAPVCLGSFCDQMLTINNKGSGPLVLTNITSSSPQFLVPDVLSFPLVVDPGDSIPLLLCYKPTALGGAAATITVDSNDPTGPKTFSVSGDCPAPSLVLMMAADGVFTPTCVGSSSDEPLNLINNGRCTLTVTSITGSSPEFIAPEVLAYPLRIAPGTNLAVPIRFQPTSLGAQLGTIIVSSDDPSGSHSIQVTGTAPSGSLAVCGSACFGGVRAGCCVERTFSLCNVGDCKLDVTQVELKCKSRFWKIVGNPFPATLRPGSCLGVIVRYTAEERCSRCCELVITSNDLQNPVTKLELTAYTIWDDCCKGEKCDECAKKACGKACSCCCEHHSSCCCEVEDDKD
jgi:photosystem II stability/assembly factor-like uncharacterized protein